MRVGTKQVEVEYAVVFDKFTFSDRNLCKFKTLEEASKYAMKYNASTNDLNMRVHVEEIKTTRKIVVA